MSASSSLSGPSCSEDDNDGLGIDELDSKAEIKVTVADIAGVMAHLNTKINLLRQEIFDLKNLPTIPLTRTSLIEENSPLGLLSEDKRTGRNFAKIPFFSFFKKKLWMDDCDECRNSSELSIPSCQATLETQNENGIVHVVGANVRLTTDRPLKSKEFRSTEQLLVKDSRRPATESAKTAPRGVESLSTSSTTSFSDKVKCSRKSEKVQCRRSWNKINTRTDSETSKKCSITECYGRRVRKRISRGVQSLPRQKRSYRFKREVVDFFKFKRATKNNSKKYRKECPLVANCAGYPAEIKNAERIIHKSRDNSVRDYASSSNATSVTNYEKFIKNPVKTNGNNMTKRNYIRKYDLSLDGTNFEIIRKDQKSDIQNRNSNKSTRSTHPRRSDLVKTQAISGRKISVESNQKVGKVTKVNQRNLSLFAGGRTQGHANESRSNKSTRRYRGIVNKKNSPVNKRNKIEKPTNDDIVESIAMNETTVMQPQGKANRLAFKWFTKSKHQSGARSPRLQTEEKSLQNQDKKPHTVNQNDIIDVKKRLDVCIAELNAIILNLSKAFQQVPVYWSPAGEGTLPNDSNVSHRSRPRLR